MVRVAVTDEHGVDRLGGHDPEEPRDDRVARIDEQPEPVMLDEVATAGTPGRRIPAAPPRTVSLISRSDYPGRVDARMLRRSESPKARASSANWMTYDVMTNCDLGVIEHGHPRWSAWRCCRLHRRMAGPYPATLARLDDRVPSKILPGLGRPRRSNRLGSRSSTTAIRRFCRLVIGMFVDREGSCLCGCDSSRTVPREHQGIHASRSDRVNRNRAVVQRHRKA